MNARRSGRGVIALVGLPGGGTGSHLGEGRHWPEVVPGGAQRPRFSKNYKGRAGKAGGAGPAGGPRGGRTCPCRAPADPACPGGAAMKLKLKNVFLAYFLVSIAGLLYALVQLGERGGAGCGGPALDRGEPRRRLLPARPSGQLSVVQVWTPPWPAAPRVPVRPRVTPPPPPPRNPLRTLPSLPLRLAG